MRIGIYGGTFNPPHIGHVVLAQEARLQLGLDEVLLVPVGRPAHRAIESDPGAEARANMCRLATLGQPGLAVSTAEIDRDGPSYTVDTLETLTVEATDSRLTLIVGSDQALSFGEWREPDRIGQLAEIAVAGREGDNRDAVLSAVSESTGREAQWVEMPRIDVSSTMIRERVAAGQTVAHLVPAGVAELIEQRGLYT